jgi:hypothetical protein
MQNNKPKDEKEQKESARKDKEKGFPPGADDPNRKEDEIRKEKQEE